MNSILLTLLSLLVHSTWLQSLTVEQQYSVPEWANRVMERGDFQKLYEMDAHLNPFCQRADFDGDGKLDSLSSFENDRRERSVLHLFIEVTKPFTSWCRQAGSAWR